MKKRMWPDDGGLKTPVREFDKSFSAFEVIRKHFSKNSEKS
jgi:hypothetical protein